MNLRTFLLPLVPLYGLTVKVRNWLFDMGLFKTVRPRVPVISVGNLSAGGTGKTPVVEWLIGQLSGKKVAVISRGYGRKSTGTVIVSDGHRMLEGPEASGDEPVQIAEKFPGIIVVVDEDRPRGADAAQRLGAEVVLLDDGFQHRWLARDLDIVLMTCEEILIGDRLLPVGNRRESWSALRRADILLITKCTDMWEFESAAFMLRSLISNVSKQVPIVGVRTKLRGLRREDLGEVQMPGARNNASVFAFSGIGRPLSFESLLRAAGLVVTGHRMFRDHHWYSSDDIVSLLGEFKSSGAASLVTTEKDTVRLRNVDGWNRLRDVPLVTALIGLEFLNDEKTLIDRVKRTMARDSA